MSNPKVSVIVPIYNSEKFLPKCLDSLVNQTLQEIEIILVNDGSTDNSLSICEEFAAKCDRIKVITTENKGQAEARNLGLDIFNGTYVGFIDSDDWVDEKYFERLYTAAEENGCDIAVSNFVREKGENKKLRLKFKNQQVFLTTESKMKVCNVPREGCVWNKIYRKEIVNNLRFVSGMYYEDGEFTLRALHKSEKLVSVPNVLYHYVVNSNSIVKSQWTDKKFNDLMMAKKNILKFILQNEIKMSPHSFMVPVKTIKIGAINLLTVKLGVGIRRYDLFKEIPVFWHKADKKWICDRL